MLKVKKRGLAKISKTHLFTKASKAFLIFLFDIGIINTMTKKNILIAKALLRGREISVLDAMRLVCNILDAKGSISKITSLEFCHKVIEVGKRNLRTKEMNFSEGLALYIESKKHLRSDSLKDIKYLSNRLVRANSELANLNFSELTLTDCETWLSQTFLTASQFNKGRAMLHALFEFALRREWCDRNPIKLIERKKVIEKEIKSLTLSQTKKLIKSASSYKDCLPAVAILTYAGIRPKEVRRLTWKDIDLDENAITVRSQCSKTGGIRSVEICPSLRQLLASYKFSENATPICPKNWKNRWKDIRDDAGFKGLWVQDILRHTYASYYAKHFRDLPRLQLNMGHRDLSLLRFRYVNMNGICKKDAKTFFYN